MLETFVLADIAAVVCFQLVKNKGRDDGQSAQDEESSMDAVNHLRRAEIKTIRSE